MEDTHKSSSRVEYTDYTMEDIKEPATVAWTLPITAADFTKLSLGFNSPMMEQKWLVTVSSGSGSDSNSISVHFARSWTQMKWYVLCLKASGSAGEGAEIESITWETKRAGEEHDEEAAKKMVVFLARHILGCEIKTLPEYGSEVFDNLVANEKIKNMSAAEKKDRLNTMRAQAREWSRRKRIEAEAQIAAEEAEEALIQSQASTTTEARLEGGQEK